MVRDALAHFWWLMVPIAAFAVLVWRFVLGYLTLSEFSALLASIIALAVLLFTVVSSRRQEKLLMNVSTRLSMEPHLVVHFPDGSDEIALAANWTQPIPKKSLPLPIQILSLNAEAKALPSGHAPLLLQVENDGQAEAQDINIFVELPPGCKAVEGSSGILLPALQRRWKSQRNSSMQIQLIGDNLGPGLHVTVYPYQWVVYPVPDKTYKLTYTAYCANRASPTHGDLTVQLADKAAAPTEQFIGERDPWKDEEYDDEGSSSADAGPS